MNPLAGFERPRNAASVVPGRRNGQTLAVAVLVPEVAASEPLDCCEIAVEPRVYVVGIVSPDVPAV